MKETLTKLFFYKKNSFRKILMVMKITSVILLIATLHLSANTLSQNKKISLSLKGATLVDVFNAIEKQSDYKIFYKVDNNVLARKLDLSANKETVRDVLAFALEGSGQSFDLVDKVIVITPKYFISQSITVKGKVTDATTGEALPGVSIMIEGSTTGTVTDIDGNYTLEAPDANSVLVFSFVGYTQQKITVGARNQIDVSMATESQLTDEVVVVGYGSVKKGDLTSAVTSVKSKDFTTGTIRDASDMVRGKIAGLSISNGSGDPSAQAVIRLRGISSLKGNSTPLVLINGIPGGLNSVAPEDIESIDVLKDASAAAIYGTRGANGVIIITTKTGKRNQKPIVTYSGYASTSSFAKKADFMTAGDIRSHLAANERVAFKDEGSSTDWLDEISRRGFAQNHSVSIAGGNTNSSYTANVTYNSKDGVFKGTHNDELKMSFDINQYFLKDKAKINFNFVKGLDNTKFVGDESSFFENIYRQALIRNPTSPVTNADGSWANELARFQYYNPLAMINESTGQSKSEWTRITSNLTLMPFKGFETNIMLATSRSNYMNGFYRTSNYPELLQAGKTGEAIKRSGSGLTNFAEFTAKYNNTFGNHKITALVGYSYEYGNSGAFNAYNYNFPTDAYTYNNIGVGYALANGKASMGSGQSSSTLIGGFGRLSYGYSDRYNVVASIRKEGSSKFGKDDRWGLFPAVSAGWTLSNESFMKDISFLSNLKLRAGYGITGVIVSDPYKSQSLLKYSNKFYSNGNWIYGLVPASNPNPNLRWEKSKETNFGIDFGFFGNRLTGTVDLYKKKTSDMLWLFQVPTPPYLYNEMLANVGEMENKGIEISITGTPVKVAGFEWESNFTASHNQNKILSLTNDFYKIEGNYINYGDCGDPISFPTHRLEVGKSIGSFWGLKSVGISEKGKWLIELPDGKIDTINTGMYNDKSKQYLGNGLPKVVIGFTNTFRYKGFDLGIVMTGAFGFQILNFQRMFYENPTINYNMLKSAYDKVYGKAVLNYPQTYVSYYIEDGDYVKIDNITLGYTLKTGTIKFVKDLRVYVSAQNVACFTKYKGLDPELTNSDPLSAGDDSRDKYPTIRTFTFGLNITF